MQDARLRHEAYVAYMLRLWQAGSRDGQRQIVPAAMGEMMSNGSPEQIARVTEAFLPMKKLDLVLSLIHISEPTRPY